MRQKRKHTQQDGEGLANLGTKAAQQALERVGAGSHQPPSDPPCPLGRPQTSKWSLPNLFEGRKGEGAALTKEKEQGPEVFITTETFGERGREEHYDKRMKCESLVVIRNGASQPSLPFPGLKGPQSLVLVLLL